jgi:putative two-component system response regulator
MTTQADILLGRILIVDDQEANVKLLEQILGRAGYESVGSTTDPREACRLHSENRYDLIMLDLLMPGMDGFEVMEELKGIDPDGPLPVLVITAQPGHKLRALEAGARDFVSKPFDVAEVLARVRNIVEVRLIEKELLRHNETLERQVTERTADLHASYLETVFTISLAAEHRDADTGDHLRRMSYTCRELAKSLGMDKDWVEEIYLASPMHDIGKISVPDSILLKPGAFTPEEWEIMKAHTENGRKILASGTSPYLKMGAEIALSHHECWDGSGYPRGRRGEDIPLSARIVKICDIYDALRSKRPYKRAFGHLKSMDIIVRGNGRTDPAHFEPAVLQAFQREAEAFRELFEAYPS